MTKRMNVMCQNNLLCCVTSPNKAPEKEKKHTSNFFLCCVFFLSLTFLLFFLLFFVGICKQFSLLFCWIMNIIHRGDIEILFLLFSRRSTFTVVIFITFFQLPKLIVWMSGRCERFQKQCDLMIYDDWLSIWHLSFSFSWVLPSEKFSVFFLTFHTVLFRLSS